MTFIMRQTIINKLLKNNKVALKQKILNKFFASRGAMDKILVTLLLVIVGIVGLIGIETWTSNQSKEIKNTSLNSINKVYEKAND